MDLATILWGILFGSFGLGYFIYGKKQKKAVALGCGVVLLVCPYIVTETIPLVMLGLLVMAIPFVVRR